MTPILQALAAMPPELVTLVERLVLAIAGHEDPMRAAEEAARSIAIDAALTKALPGPK